MHAKAFILLVTAGTALCFDLRTGRIPNILTLVSSVTGLLLQTMGSGTFGIADFILGTTIPLVILLPLFRFRMMGAGDIKLLMALGGIAGFSGMLRIMLWSFVAGGIAAFIRMIRAAGFRERFHYLYRYVLETRRSGRITPYRKKGKRPENFPFSVPVFIAAVIVVGREYLSFIAQYS